MSAFESSDGLSFRQVLSTAEWRDLLDLHRIRAQRWTLPALQRRSQHISHPMADFLFTYYAFPLAKLEQWHPGWGVAMRVEADDASWPAWWQRHYIQRGSFRFADPVTLREKDQLRLFRVAQLLRATAERTACFTCYGLHEWAMVYRADQVRHADVAPLRLSADEIAAVIDTRSIRCSHFDAFRFFTPAARPLNRLMPGANDRDQFEQPGCVHANMDLYKWAFQGIPWVPGRLLLDTFELAMELRELDMRASPYDLTAWQLEPICIETVEGRLCYEQQQRHLAARSQVLRRELLDVYESVLTSIRAIK